MSTVEELSELHQRYLDLSNRFKAVWTFHQFLQGLAKILPDHPALAEPISFQLLYGDIKSLAKELSTNDPRAVSERIDDTARRLDDKVVTLVEQDQLISPSKLRQFFDRVRSYDRRILVQLLRAYLYVRKGRGWTTDLMDKADFLATRLGEELAEPNVPAIERDPRHHRDLWRALWQLLEVDEPSPEAVEDTVKEIRTLREAMRQAESLDQFNELGLIAGYRRLKHALGDRFFYPAILEELMRTNLYLREVIGDFYEMEERRIATEWQQVFELERDVPVDEKLGGELEAFRGEVERLEQRLEHKEMRLNEIANVRDHARRLLPRLNPRKSTSPSEGSAESPVLETRPDDGGSSPDIESTGELPARRPATRPEAALRIKTVHADLLADPLRRILGLLEKASWEDSPRAVASMPDPATLRLEPREVVAFRRLHEPDSCNAELEQFLLEGAALRTRIAAQAEEVIAARNNARAEQGEREALGRSLCHLAGQFERRLDLYVLEAVQADDNQDARNLIHLRMRLIREYAGLWLLVYPNRL